MKTQTMMKAVLAMVLTQSVGLQGCAVDAEPEPGEEALVEDAGEVQAAAGNIFTIVTTFCGLVAPSDPGRPSFLYHFLVGEPGCHPVPQHNRHWILYPLNGAWRVQNRDTNLCMKVRDGSKQNGALVDQDGCTAVNSALWKLEVGTTPSAKRLRNVSTNKCLNIAGGVSGTTMIQYTCGNYLNEDFYFMTVY